MAIDNTFMKKKLEKMEEVVTLFSQATRLPYVECDAETFDDQVYVFSDQEKMNAFAKNLTDQKIGLTGVKIPKERFLSFYNTLFAIGVNALMFQEGDAVTRIQLEELAQKPDMEKMEQEKVPVLNPTLQLSTIYFLQELRRPVEHDMQHLREMEEEMIVNFVKSKFILGLDVSEVSGEWDPKDPNQPVKIPYLKDKDGNMFQPVFSDFTEFQKFHKEKAAKMRMASMSLGQLQKYLVKDSKGFLINPSSIHLELSREQLERIVKAFKL
ncbi:MAG: SseB family protein [Lachnospiraceae bacterium]|nr:SseB family protein [Lachnospiraceae bacterium]